MTFVDRHCALAEILFGTAKKRGNSWIVEYLPVHLVPDVMLHTIAGR